MVQVSAEIMRSWTRDTFVLLASRDLESPNDHAAGGSWRTAICK